MPGCSGHGFIGMDNRKTIHRKIHPPYQNVNMINKYGYLNWLSAQHCETIRK